MGKFFRSSRVFPQGFGRGEPFAPPVGQDAVVPLPNAFPVGGTVPVTLERSQPMIRPEVIGAVPQKPILPPLFDAQTKASFYDRGSFSVPVPMDPLAPQGASSLAPPPPVSLPFTTKASVAIDKAVRQDNRALIAAKISLDTQRRADIAAHASIKADARAALDPSPQARGDAEAKAKAAAIAAELAARAAADAAKHQSDADATTAKAHELLDQMDDRYGPPGFLPPGYTPATTIPEYRTASRVPTVVAAGGGAAVGFMVGGPVGALIGALLGGVGYNYVKSH